MPEVSKDLDGGDCSVCKGKHAEQYDDKRGVITLLPKPECKFPRPQGYGTPGERYRPSNGTEGMIFQEDWCLLCKHWQDEPGCPIYNASHDFDEDDKRYPNQWVYAEDGWGSCTAYWEDEALARIREAQRSERARYQRIMRGEAS